MSTRIYLSRDDAVYLEKLRDILGSNLGQPAAQPVQILPHVWLGSQRNAEHLRLLRRLGISHVLNTAGYKGPRPKPEVSPYEGLGIDYYEFKAEDCDTYNITQHFPESFRYLDEVHHSGGVALVHCALGINRSATICVAYMMTYQKTTLLRAVQHVKDKRRLCLTNKGFLIQLITFARRKRLLDPLPVEQRDLAVRRGYPTSDSALHYRSPAPEEGRYSASMVERPLHKYREHQRDYRELHRVPDVDKDDFFGRYIENRMKDLTCNRLLCGSSLTAAGGALRRSNCASDKATHSYDSKYSFVG